MLKVLNTQIQPYFPRRFLAIVGSVYRTAVYVTNHTVHPTAELKVIQYTKPVMGNEDAMNRKFI